MCEQSDAIGAQPFAEAREVLLGEMQMKMRQLGVVFEPSGGRAWQRLERWLLAHGVGDDLI